MGCSSVKCKTCGAGVPACQLINGVCGTCRSKEQQAQAVKAPEHQRPPAPIRIP
jgi:hypothetical protein